MKVGDRVETPDGSHHDIIRITEDSGIQLSDCHYYCRSELKLVDNKPTKMELIDKAIDDLDGDISMAMYHDWKGHTHLKYSNGYYRLCHYDSSSVVDGLCFCTIEEFEQRKEEREMEKKNNWYDYENQKPVGYPPIGEEVYCDYFTSPPAIVRVIGYDMGGVVSKYLGSFYCRNISYFKPLDWDKLSKRKQAIAYAMELSPDWAKLEDIFGSLYDAGMLKLPESSKAEEK